MALFEEVYAKPYVKKVVDAVMNGLDVLAFLSFDVGLLFWIKGLKHELRKRIEEYEKKRKEEELKRKGI